MNEPLVPSADLARRIHQAEVSYTRQRLGVLQRLAGNPVVVEMEDLGQGGWFLLARFIPNIHFNRVAGLTEAHVPRLAALADRFAECDVSGVFDVIPGMTPQPVIDELIRLGIGHKAFHATLAAAPAAGASPASGVCADAACDPSCRGRVRYGVDDRGVPLPGTAQWFSLQTLGFCASIVTGIAVARWSPRASWGAAIAFVAGEVLIGLVSLAVTISLLLHSSVGIG